VGDGGGRWGKVKEGKGRFGKVIGEGGGR